MPVEVKNWSDIKRGYHDSILLGNGASIAIDSRLSYRSLYEKVHNSRTLNDEIINMFGHFDTANFEFIMRLLLEASEINEVLNIHDGKTKQYYFQLRDALINTINEIHPTYEGVKHLLPVAARFLSNFQTVLSLNYDLLVYWTMLAGNESLKCTWFKDGFVLEGGKFEHNFQYLYSHRPPATGSTLVFYPHGSLFLATDLYGNEVKLVHDGDHNSLLGTILSKWSDQDYIPLFVSEGTSQQKYLAIGRSSYLNSVYESVLRKVNGSLVIYGWSASENDEHIFNVLDHRNIERLAISVFIGDKNWESKCLRVPKQNCR